MIPWLQANWGTLLALLVIAGVVAAIVVFRVRAHRQGRSSCGCGCDHCTARGVCHADNEKKREG